MIGESIGDYEITGSLGKGGFGVVYRAIQPLVEREVAVKIILPRYADHPEFIRRFEAEAQLVARLEHPYIVPLYDYWREPDGAYLVMRLMKGGSLEEAGRQARYRFYTQTAQKEGFDKIALGHHADDNAELVLMNMLRGAGPMGIAGIPPSREPGIIRPLIHVKRFQIKAYIKDNNLDYVEDASNQDTRFLRNRVRHELLPLLTEAYNPRVADALVRLATISRSPPSTPSPAPRSHPMPWYPS